MGRPVCEAFKERNQEMAEKYQGGMPIADLVRNYGLGPIRIKQLLKLAGVYFSQPPVKGDRAFSNRTVAMGAKLHHNRMKRGITPAAYAVELGLSEIKLRDAVVGRHPWTILEMERAADVLGIPLEDFIAPPKGV